MMRIVPVELQGIVLPFFLYNNFFVPLDDQLTMPQGQFLFCKPESLSPDPTIEFTDLCFVLHKEPILGFQLRHSLKMKQETIATQPAQLLLLIDENIRVCHQDD